MDRLPSVALKSRIVMHLMVAHVAAGEGVLLMQEPDHIGRCKVGMRCSGCSHRLVVILVLNKMWTYPNQVDPDIPGYTCVCVSRNEMSLGIMCVCTGA